MRLRRRMEKARARVKYGRYFFAGEDDVRSSKGSLAWPLRPLLPALLPLAPPPLLSLFLSLLLESSRESPVASGGSI